MYICTQQLGLDGDARDTVNALLRKYKTGILLIVKNGKIELLVDHIRYIEPEKDAARLTVVKHSKCKDGLYYITHETW